jgi:hypothetical protein
VNFTMWTPSLAVVWLWIVALAGFGRSWGTRDGQFVRTGWEDVGQGGGGE